jgi:hypothetical protein
MIVLTLAATNTTQIQHKSKWLQIFLSIIYIHDTVSLCFNKGIPILRQFTKTELQKFYQASSFFRPGGSDIGLFLDPLEEARASKATTAKGIEVALAAAGAGGIISLA